MKKLWGTHGMPKILLWGPQDTQKLGYTAAERLGERKELTLQLMPRPLWYCGGQDEL